MVPDRAEANQRMVPVCRSIFRAHGFDLQPGKHRVLDFGCGLGRHVREFQEAGYDAAGVDQPADLEVQALQERPCPGVYLSSRDGTLPFESESFDFCFSTSVMEHVMDYDRALAEIRRVLRPGGYSLHVFPARLRPIESHMYVPLGGRIQHPAWFRLWAALGIRNEYQRGTDASQAAEANLRYAKTGINYPTKREIERTFGAHFERVEFVERRFVEATKAVSRASRAVGPFIGLPAVGAIYRGFHTRVVLTQKTIA